MRKFFTDSGFTCEVHKDEKEDHLFCITDETEKPDLRLHAWKGGFRIFTYYFKRQGVTYESEALRSLVNDLNENALITRYYMDRDGDVTAEFWYPFQDYRPDVFQSMIRAFLSDYRSSLARFSERFRQLFRIQSDNPES